MDASIEQELEILKGHMANFAEILYSAAHDGRIAGHTPMTHNIWPAATIYTHLARGDFMRGLDLVHEVRSQLGQSKWDPSPLELFLYSIQPGDRPATCSALKDFMRLLEPYLLYPDKRSGRPEQQSLW